jgi:tetratricopeptide (TPR) repeat protein
MTDRWRVGLQHFERDNYYAVIDLCRRASEQSDSPLDRATYLNSLGAAMYRLRGPRYARMYYEEALALLSDADLDDDLIKLRMKCSANLALVLGHEGHEDAALKVCNSILELITKDYPFESSVLANSYIYSLIRAELYEQVLHSIDDYISLAQEVPDEALRKSVEGLLYYNAGCAAEALGDVELSLENYLKAAQINPLPEPYQGVARMYLYKERANEAVKYASQLYRSVWDKSMTSETLKLADSMFLIALFALYANQNELCERCLEKAELYLGQASYWNEWLKVRDFHTWAPKRNVKVPEDSFDWPLWHQFLDELNLMDSLGTMFPRLAYVPRYEANLATQLFKRIVPNASWSDTRRLQVAGRLAYLGLTVMTSNEEEALSILSDESSHVEVGQLGARLLEAYPHSVTYRQLIPACRRGADRQGLSAEDELMADCLGLSLAYVEAMELYELTHDEAMQVLADKHFSQYDPRVVQAFLDQMTV